MTQHLAFILNVAVTFGQLTVAYWVGMVGSPLDEDTSAVTRELAQHPDAIDHRVEVVRLSIDDLRPGARARPPRGPARLHAVAVDRHLVFVVAAGLGMRANLACPDRRSPLVASESSVAG